MVNGLAWTSVGGEILPIEVAVMKGSGKLELTGNLGNVMKESARAAVSCVRMRTDILGLPANFHTSMDIHIHVPGRSHPKRRSFRGLLPWPRRLRRHYLNPGALRCGDDGGNYPARPGASHWRTQRKTMAAYRAGIKTVIIPADNEPDLAEIDQVVKDGIEFHPVSKLDEVLRLALVEMPKPAPLAPQKERDAACSRRNRLCLRRIRFPSKKGGRRLVKIEDARF